MSDGAIISISWNGESLTAEIPTSAGSIRCVISRETVHAISIFNDAVGWEIDRYKTEILDHLKTLLSKKIGLCGQAAEIRLDPTDVAGLHPVQLTPA